MRTRAALAALIALSWLTVPQSAHAAPGAQGPGEVKVGATIHLSGSGWTVADGTSGSVLAFKLDEGGISTKGTVTNPSTGAVIANKTVYAAVEADAHGDWEVDLPFPTTDNATGTFEPGRHGVRILSGSLKTGDVTRSELVEFDVVADQPEPEPTTAPTTAPTGEPTAPPTTPAPAEPGWSHETVTIGGATAWIEDEVAAGDGHSIRIAGQGWTTTGGRGSTIAVKLNRSATQQYTRSGDEIVDHPSASGDDTIWALFTAEADGTFSRTLDAPDGLVAGQYLSVTLLSGRFDAGDVQRSTTSGLLVVGGLAHEGGGDDDPDVACVPTTVAAAASATIVRSGLGGVLRLTGTGWCHPTQGGSTIGVKIDEGAYSHLDTTIHQNKTIWAIVEADPATGVLDAEIDLPDGTTTGPRGSAPAFVEGAHTLRLLSGSLKSGDTVRTLQTRTFVVGAYQPTVLPEPLEFTEDLTEAARSGLTAARFGDQVVVTVPGLAAGAWVALSAYHEDGSPDSPWGATWFRADASGRVSASAAALPDERVKLVAQSGDEDSFGRLLGWTWFGQTRASSPVPAPATSPPPRKRLKATPAPATSPVVAQTIAAVAAVAAGTPTTAPAPPADSAEDLAGRERGGVRIDLDGTVAVVTVPGAAALDWVHPFVYPATGEPIAVGWVQLDADRRLRLDLSALGEGEWTIAFVDRTATLVGWARTRVGDAPSPVVAEEPPATTGPPAVASVAGATDGSLGTADWWLLGAGAAVAIGAAAGTLSTRKKVTA